MNSNTNLLKAIFQKQNNTTNKSLEILVKDELGKVVGKLVCIDKKTIGNDSIISLLTKWRNQYMEFFLTQFNATFERTKKWLENIVIPANDRLLFIIYSAEGKPIGNFGICDLKENAGELDNLIRGEKSDTPKMIFLCEIALLTWMFEYLNYDLVNLHVFSNNEPTIKLHKSVGFGFWKKMQLSRKQTPEHIQFLIDSSEGVKVSFDYCEMRLNRDEFLNKFAWTKDAYSNFRSCDRL